MSNRPAQMHYKWFLLASSIAVIVTLAGIFTVLMLGHGWDAQIFCAAARTAGSGGNPYDVRQLGLNLSWNYQPYLLALFKALCQAPVNFASSYPILYVVLLISGVAVWKPGSDPLLAMILSLGGFCGFTWAIRTGNVAVPEFLLISLVTVLLERRKWYLGGVILAFLASLKLLTIAYLFLLVFVPEATSKRLRVLAISLLVFALTFGISYALYPNLMKPFSEQLFGLIPDQHNAWIETARMTNLPLAFFLTDVLALLGIHFTAPSTVVVGTLLSFGIVFQVFRKVLSPHFIREHFLDFFNLGVIAITLILPRLKPYSFLMVVPAVFYLLRSHGKLRQGMVVILSVVFPAVILLFQLTVGVRHEAADLLLAYAPTISLLATFALLIPFVPLQSIHARTSRSRNPGT